MNERRENGLCLNCDDKYNNEWKCSENELFYIDCEDNEYKEVELSQDPKLEETTPTISCHALDGINTKQTLNIEGYIKNKIVIRVID